MNKNACLDQLAGNVCTRVFFKKLKQHSPYDRSALRVSRIGAIVTWSRLTADALFLIHTTFTKNYVLILLNITFLTFFLYFLCFSLLVTCCHSSILSLETINSKTCDYLHELNTSDLHLKKLNPQSISTSLIIVCKCFNQYKYYTLVNNTQTVTDLIKAEISSSGFR